MIKLGSKVRDKVTGFTGIVVAITQWLHGCNRVAIQSQQLKDGKPIDPVVFDELQVEEVVEKAVPVDTRKSKTGGPQNDRAALAR